MTPPLPVPSTLSDQDLISEVSRLATSERAATAALIVALAELDVRRLYVDQGYASLFVYCVRALGLSEAAAYHRIEAARACRAFPVVIEALRDGALTLSTLCLLRPHLTEANHVDLLAAARGRSKRHVEEMIARLRPTPDVRSSLRKAPEPRHLAAECASPAAAAATPSKCTSLLTTPASTGVRLESMTPIGQASPARALQASTPATIRPLAPGRYHLHVTLSADAHAHLRRLQDLMRHEIPTGDAALIIERALACLAQHVAGRQLAATRTEAKREVAKRDAAKQRSRHIPAEVKREVVRRDGGQCTFVGTRGRCQERSFLEFHHVVPFAAGGEATVSNTRLLCRTHNAREAERFFGACAAADLFGGVTAPGGG